MPTMMLVPVRNLRVGDHVDLYGDAIADPKSNRRYRAPTCNLVTDKSERENSVWIQLGNAENFVFPSEHMIRVDAA